ncbi:MAG: 50S ribosomal protein L31 [Coriobacteriia bacterium]|nr:50S ribosomal protein L31 [Coriobacteriia bacterium]
MREGIHPDYVESTVTCSCGESFKTRSTKSELHIELCSKCHPFYTGTQKLVDSGGRVQRFADKFGASATDVIEREAVERAARQKVHEETALAAREARAAKDAEKAAKSAKHETAVAAVEGVADAVAVEAPAEEAPAEEAPAEESAE